MIDLETLDPKSRAFAHELFRAAPHLKRFARNEPSPGGGHYLVLCLDPPSGRRESLVVDTGDPDRVTVSWGRFHAEFDAPPGAGRSSELPAALDLVEDILAEAIAVYAVTRDGRYVESGTLTDERDEARLLSRLPAGAVCDVWSWEGNRDARLERGVS